MRAQLLLERGPFLFDLALEVGIAFGQVLELDEVASAPLEAVPRRDLVTQLRRFARHLSGALGIVPDPRLDELGV